MPYAVIDDAGYAGAPDPEVVERLGLAGRHVLLYVGRIARNKRVHDLVAALPAILERHPQALLLLVGDAQAPAYRAYADEVAAQAAALGVADALRLTGQVDDATLDSLYRACAAFLTASEHEGFCMPVVEAMSRGRPVIAADATGTPHTLGGAGLLFSVGDAATLATQVVRLLDDLPAPGDHSDPLAIHRLATATEDDLASLRARKVAVVTPRYGTQILGGAESGLRSWAEQLAARGYTVEALSTGTVDMGEWRDHLPPGVEELNGVTVRRFSAAKVEVGIFHRLLQRLNRGERPRYDEEQAFIANSLRSADLERYVAEHAEEYACFVYAPYLFGTTYFPALVAPERAIVVPCLHDEPAARLGIFRELLERAAAICYNADPEATLASAGLGVTSPYHEVLGFGFPDTPEMGDAAAFRARTGIDGPALLYTGRLEHAKNVPLLVEYFTRYKDERPGPLTLALSGSGDVKLPARSDVVRLGMIERDQLADAYAGALALCQLSQNESFSIVIMESWLQSRPVIVHAGCPVTSDHVAQSGGGYAVGSYEAFRDAVDALLADAAHGDELGARGRAYVQGRYAWGSLVPRIEAALARLSRSRPLYARLAQRGVARALAFTRQRFRDEQLHLVERALGASPAALAGTSRETLQRSATIARPGYNIRSGLPVIGGMVAWVRRQLTAHLKEPYLDPVIADQERFNRDLVATLLPALDASLHEQRRLRAEVDLLRSEVERLREGDEGKGEG
jgi:glycosyltransferase involved in cell wall biosynthesis